VAELLQDFKKFLMQGNLITLAVAVVIGTVFAAVVKAMIADLITPIIALIFGKQDFSALSFTINSSHFMYGDFINAVFTFVTTATAVFFFVVKPYEAFEAAKKKGASPEVKDCPECTSEIAIAARRCPYCTAQIA
jgi:large conductance mechanosensitive channel